MRCLTVLAFVAAACLSACVEEDPAPLFVDLDYQVRCLDCEPRTPDDDPHRIQALDGEAGFTIECNATRRSGDRVLSFSANYIDAERESDNFSISVIQANLDSDDPGTSCRLVVTEGDNRYEGKCTGGAPTPEEQCQLEIGEEDKIVSGELRCDHVPNLSSTLITRYVVEPGSDDPVQFEVHGCSGL
jgi:hypothetical protein